MAEVEMRRKAWGIALGLVVFAIVGVDYVLLKGETVASASVSIGDESDTATLPITRTGEPHLFEITTRIHSQGKVRGASIRYRLEDPSGQTVFEDSELVSHKKRYFELVPQTPGEYHLYAQRSNLTGRGRGRAEVDVTVGDHRFLSRLVGF